MSRQNRWCSKADILKDLAEVTGRMGDVDERYIVVGEEPPPVRTIDEEDDEFNLRFGGNSHQLEDHVAPAPDLRGITQMLRMVDEYDCDDDNIDLQPAPMKPSELIVISKLNPEVPEFVPKFAAGDIPGNLPESVPKAVAPKSPVVSPKKPNITNSSIINSTNLNKPNGILSIKRNLDKLKEVKEEKNILSPKYIYKPVNSSKENDNNDKKNEIVFKIDKKMDVSEWNPEEIKDIRNKLRSKISAASKEDSKQSKREKNVAIATLLKLCTTPPRHALSPKKENGDDDISNKAIKLYTPDYFEKLPTKPEVGANQVLCEVHGVVVDIESNAVVSQEDSSKHSLKTSNISEDSLEVSKTAGLNSPKSVTSKTNEETKEIDKSSQLKCDAAVPTQNIHTQDRDVRDSINKVNKWLAQPKSPKPKPPTICLGPIGFKRKSPATMSPASELDKSNRSTPTSISAAIAQYKPSQYAADLSKKFTERRQLLQIQHLDIWQKAELLMREKEAKLYEQSSSGISDVDDSGA